MKDEDKTKDELIKELVELRQRIAGLEMLESEHKKMGEELKNLQERLKILFEYAPDAYYLNDLKGNFVDGNKVTEELVGYKREELIGKNFLKLKLLPPDQIPKVAAALAKNALGQPTGPDEFIINRKDGRQVVVAIKTFPVKIKNKNLVLAIARDITKHKQMEKVLRQSEQNYRTIFETTGTATTLIEEDRTISLVNEEFEKLSGYSREEVEGKKKWTEFVVEDDLERMKEYHHLRRINPRAAPRNYEFRLVDRKGEIKDIFLTIGMVPGTKKSVASLLEITARKRAEKALQRSEEKLRNIFSSSPDAITVTDLKGNITECNQVTLDMHGFSTKKELIGRSAFDLIAPKDHQRALENMEKTLKEGFVKNVEYTFLTKNGNDFPAELSVSVIQDPSGKPISFVAITKDISERKKAEERRRKLYALETTGRNINEVLVRIRSEPKLFQRICGLLTEIEDFRFAWIGLVQKGTFEVKPVAQAGLKKRYLSSIKVRWDDSQCGRGPTGMAIKTGQPFIMRDIENDSRYEPLREEAQKRGYASSIALPLARKEEIIGALNVYSGQKDSFKEEEIKFLTEVATDIAVGVETLRLEKKLQQSLEKLEKTLQGTINTLALVVETRDPYTAGHQQRVTQLVCAIAKEMGLSEEQVNGLHFAATIHDLGKISIPAEILSKPGRISEIEFRMIKNHPRVGYDILKEMDFAWPIAQIILQHHERLDGSGYPQGLLGKDIMLEARILGVADVVEAMTSHRPYRPAQGIDKALEEISQNKDVLYDPKVVDACLRLFTEEGFKFK